MIYISETPFGLLKTFLLADMSSKRERAGRGEGVGEFPRSTEIPGRRDIRYAGRYPLICETDNGWSIRPLLSIRIYCQIVEQCRLVLPNGFAGNQSHDVGRQRLIISTSVEASFRGGEVVCNFFAVVAK